MSWHVVAASEDLPAGSTHTVEIGAAEIVLWRSAAGVLAACEARCPHQWAHLGAAGVVDGEELVCLSHHWRFTAEGSASKMAMNGRRDDKDSILSFAVREIKGRVEVRVAAGSSG